MNNSLNPKPHTLIPKKIGIVGGGQLGRMLAIAAKQLGFYVVVTDPTPSSPAGQVADKQIIGGYKDDATIRQLAKEVDVITIDAEFVNTDTLLDLENKGKKVFPSPKTIELIKDKLLQKEFLKTHKIPTADFSDIPSSVILASEMRPESPTVKRDAGQASMTIKKTIEQIAQQFGYPLLLKARTDAYDGKGNFVVHSEIDIAKGLEKLKGRPLYVERFVPFEKELAVMIARNIKDDIAIYPVVETIHQNNILDYLLCPADISDKARHNASELAKKVMQQMKGAGIFGIEMFLKKDDTVLVNEIAPRVHNSGHYTIEASITSQFEQHIRAITGLPLGVTDLLPKAVVMKNILGEKNGSGIPEGLEKVLAMKNVTVHMYGKHESRIGRKMGHITVVGSSTKECLTKANKARKALVI